MWVEVVEPPAWVVDQMSHLYLNCLLRLLRIPKARRLPTLAPEATGIGPVDYAFFVPHRYMCA